mmetsp:Transcript_3820/g.4124  ORF Transcript_3820/g.4124 Transcript_3820/m.4124 type:complete len:82 (+) Transcript_3820:59-304(+)
MIKFRDENDLQSSITNDYYDHENVVENRTRFTEWSKAREFIFENNLNNKVFTIIFLHFEKLLPLLLLFFFHGLLRLMMWWS